MVCPSEKILHIKRQIIVLCVWEIPFGAGHKVIISFAGKEILVRVEGSLPNYKALSKWAGKHGNAQVLVSCKTGADTPPGQTDRPPVCCHFAACLAPTIPATPTPFREWPVFHIVTLAFLSIFPKIFPQNGKSILFFLLNMLSSPKHIFHLSEFPPL